MRDEAYEKSLDSLWKAINSEVRKSTKRMEKAELIVFGLVQK